jgi:hypothetical protein
MTPYCLSASARIRRAQLESLVAGIDGLTFSEAIEGDGAIVFDHAYRLGRELPRHPKPSGPTRAEPGAVACGKRRTREQCPGQPNLQEGINT